MKNERRYPIFSRTVCALAVTGLLVVPLAFYGAPALAKSVATAHERGGDGQYSTGAAYSSQAQYGDDDSSQGDDDSSAVQYSNAGQDSSSSQYQYTVPSCISTGFHTEDGLLARSGSRGRRHHHQLGANITPCSTTAGQRGDDDSGNQGDDGGGGNPGNGHFGSGGGSSQSSHGVFGTRKS